MQTITCPCCLTEYDSHDSPVEYARVNKQNTMNETKHTPGPWTIGKKNRIQAGKLVLIGEHEIASRPNNDLYVANEEQDANARLISAAPDLLEACKMLMEELSSRFDYVEPTPEESAALCKIEAAISKAEGGSK